MRDDDAPGGRLAVETAQLLHYVFVGEAVEAVADDALLREPTRKRVESGHARHPAVECGVEASHLRDRRARPANGLDRPDRLGKVAWVEPHQCPESGNQLRGDTWRPAMEGATAH